MYGREKLRIGEMLVESGHITEEQVEEILEAQREEGGQFGDIAIAKQFVKSDDLLYVLGEKLDLPVVNLLDIIIDPELPKKLPHRIATRHQILPIEQKEDVIVLAVADPLNVNGIDEAAIMLQSEVEICLCKKHELLSQLDEFYGSADSMEGLLEDITEDDMELVKDEADFTGGAAADEAEDNKIIKYVNLIILEAIKNRASDIHLEPFENEFVIRQRIDGVLHKMPAPPKQVQSAVSSRIKVMADLNIAENRLPQDGRIKLKLGGKEIDLRVACLPTVFGESVVLRLLDRSAQILTLKDLGMQPQIQERASKVIKNPNGIVLVTGPTGSGKTSTLYAFVDELESAEDKFITVEDPVEYEVEGIVQCQVREKVGMTFAAALRSILRQDPDIVLIGEIRDVETAEISIQAALTGHLVLSTLHTNEAAGAITRLIDMGLEPFLLSSTVLGIIGQRLIRTNCAMCKQPFEPDKEILKLLAPEDVDINQFTYYRGEGCEECAGTGFKGRIGIYELFVMDEEIIDLVLQKTPANILHAKSRLLGMQTMGGDGWVKVSQGISTPEELLRVAPSDLPMSQVRQMLAEDDDDDDENESEEGESNEKEKVESA